MAYRRYSVRVDGVERVVMDIDMTDPGSAIFYADSPGHNGIGTPLQIGGMGPTEAAYYLNGWLMSEGGAAFGIDETIEVIELGGLCAVCAAYGIETVATTATRDGLYVCEGCKAEEPEEDDSDG